MLIVVVSVVELMEGFVPELLRLKKLHDPVDVVVMPIDALGLLNVCPPPSSLY